MAQMTVSSNPFAPSTAEPTYPKLRDGEEWYQIGLAQLGPCWHQTIAGINFPQYTIHHDSQGREIPKVGALIRLTKVQLTKIAEVLPHKWVRQVRKPNGELIKADVFDDRDTGFTKEPEDEPLEPYVILRLAPPELLSQRQVVGSVFATIQAELEKAKARDEKAAATDQREKTSTERNRLAKKAGMPVSSGEDL